MITTEHRRIFRREALRYQGAARGELGAPSARAPRWTRQGIWIALAAGLLAAAVIATLPVVLFHSHVARVLDGGPDWLMLVLVLDADDELALTAGDEIGISMDARSSSVLSARVEQVRLNDEGGYVMRLGMDSRPVPDKVPDEDARVRIWLAEPRRPVWSVLWHRAGPRSDD